MLKIKKDADYRKIKTNFIFSIKINQKVLLQINTWLDKTLVAWIDDKAKMY